MRVHRTAVAVVAVLLLLPTAAGPAGADASSLTLDDDEVPTGSTLTGTVVDGPADDGNRIVVTLDADGDGVYDNGEPQVRVSSDDAGAALAWSGLETDGLAAGNYTVYAQEANSVRNRDPLAGATATVRLVDEPPVISNFRVENPTGGEIRVSLESSEPLATVSASISGAENATLATADFTESGSGPYAYTATYEASAAGTYTATLTAAVDAGGNDGASGESGSVTIAVDPTPPELVAAQTVDADGDGTVDAVELTFSEPIDDASLAADDVSVDGATVTGVSTGAEADDETAVLAVSELPDEDTSLTPRVVMPPRRVSDLAGNEGPTSATSLTAADGAAPVILGAATVDADADGRIDRLNVSLSEPVVPASVDGGDYDVGHALYFDEAVVAVPDGARYLILGFSEGPADDTGATPPLVYTRGTTADAAGNAMADRTIVATDDGAAPTLALSTANATPEGFAVRARASEAATVAYVVVENGAPAPTTDQVLLGRDAVGTAAVRWGAILVPAAGTNASATLVGLPSSTSYDVYAVATDGWGNRRGPPRAAGATTLSAPAADGGRTAPRRGTSVRAAFSPGEGVTVEIRNPRPSRAVTAPLGGLTSDGVIFQSATFEFAERASSVRVELRPGVRDGADPGMADARVLAYFAVRRLDGGTTPISSLTLEIRVRESAVPADAVLGDVGFYRFVDGRWTPLESTRGGETFRVATGGLSSFAVAVPAESTPAPTATTTATTAEPPPNATVSTAPPTSTAAPTTSRPVATPGADQVAAALALGVFAVLAVAAVLWRRHRRRD